MSVALVLVLSFLGLLLVPPVFVARLARAFATPRSKTAEDCRTAPNPVISALRADAASRG
jgi:hypothetical protein